MGLEKREEDKVSVEFYINGVEIGYYCVKFEWTCFLNCGHRIAATFIDPYENILDTEMINGLLEKSKHSDGVDARIKIHQKYSRKGGKTTEERKFKVLSLNSYLTGGLAQATLEVVCIDKASWLLSRGKCEGRAFKGRIGGKDGAISQIIKKYAEDLSVHVDDTKDSKNNYWWEMRLDPKTLISSLIEWSSSITNSETPFVIHCQDNEFKCREWSKLPPTKTNGKKFYVANQDASIKEWDDTCELQVLSNQFLQPSATKLYTGSISATTGLYIDKKNGAITEDKHKFVNDKLTAEKLGPKPLKKDQAFTQYDLEFSTFIEPIPEHNNGDLGMTYQQYAIGRARDWYTKIMYTSLRVKIMIDPGDTDFDSIYACGRDKINLEFFDLQNKPYYLNGNWMLYGFRHLIDKKHWKTELLLCRLDYNAERKPI